MNSFVTKVADPGRFISLIQETKSAIDISMSVPDGISIFELTSLPRESQKLVSEVYISRIAIHFADHAAPVRIDYSYEEKNVSRVFSDWTTIDGRSVPQGVKTYMPDGFVADAMPVEVANISYAEFDRPLPKAECYLSHYDLPEPHSVVSASRWRYFWLGLLGIAVAIVALFLHRRQRRY